MLYNSIYIRKFNGKTNMFYIRLTNTGSTVTINTLNNLLNGYTGNPTLQTAVVERSGGVNDNVKGTGNSINNFVVASNESCIFRMKWSEGVFVLQVIPNNSYRNIVRSAGCEISGDYDIPDNFMSYLFFNCINYNQQSEDIFNTSELNTTNIINGFLRETWDNCTSLINAAVPYTSNWNVS